MSKTGELDSTTKNIVREIMREITNMGIQISDSFVAYYVQLLMLNPTRNINSDTLPNRNDTMNFIKHCIHFLEKQECPCITTLKIQLYFMSNFDDVENMIIKNRADLKARLAPLEKEIVETQTDIKEDIEKLYKKIIYLVTLYAGLGNPTVKSVYTEAEAALRSVFLESDLNEFMVQTSWNKELQIVELTELVTGIRLFNRDCQKGGAGIEDLPKLLNQAIEATNSDIQRSLITIMDNVYMYTTAIDNCFKIEQDEFNDYILTGVFPDGVQEEDLKHVKDLLIAYRQYELFVRKILVELGRIEKIAREKFQNFQDAIIRLHETVRFRIAIPTIQVFPLFCDVAHLWCELQDQTVSLSQLNQMLFNLQMHIKEMPLKEEIVKLMVGPEGPITDGERLLKTTGLTIAPMETEATVLDPSDIKDFDKMTLQYLGFCAWKFVETDGGLIPGNPNMGVVKVKDMFYIFSSPEAAEAFGKNPSRYVLRALHLVRNRPDLINFLEMHEQLVAVREIQELVVEVPKVIISYDNEVQTDLHPIETKIDPNYKWNIWDWKRQAILLANLSKCQTHSAQTVKSGAWAAARTQTQYTKEFSYQTKKDNYSNVPTLSNYIYGLRGRKDDIQHIITLTRPVEEQAAYNNILKMYITSQNCNNVNK